MSHLSMFACSYAYRIKSVALFEEDYPIKVFDLFFLNDTIKMKEFGLYENLWRETLLLHQLNRRG